MMSSPPSSFPHDSAAGVQPIVRPTIAVVVSQHAEESAALRHVRSVLVRAPHVRLHQLRRLDDRIAAHLDGLVVAGPDGWKLAVAALESPGAGEVFAAAVLALQDGNAAALDRLLALAEAHRPGASGLISALGWVSAQTLRGSVASLLASGVAFRRQMGLTACAMHRVDPGAALDSALTDAEPSLRARALRVAGELGRQDRLRACLAALEADEDPACAFHAARSALLLGDRNASLEALRASALSPGPHRTAALRLFLMTASPPQSHAVLKVLAQEPARIRLLIQGVAAAGDPHYVPWLIRQMEEPKLARLAGESFSLITGLDLAYLDLEIKPPQGVDFGPSDDPEDDNVAMDEDDSLPWPDPVKLTAWWRANEPRFAAGTRRFMGQPPTPEHGLQVLKDGFQRQRIDAALQLCLLRPSTPLFPSAAPAWRQKRWLDAMG